MMKRCLMLLFAIVGREGEVEIERQGFVVCEPSSLPLRSCSDTHTHEKRDQSDTESSLEGGVLVTPAVSTTQKLFDAELGASVWCIWVCVWVVHVCVCVWRWRLYF